MGVGSYAGVIGYESLPPPASTPAPAVAHNPHSRPQRPHKTLARVLPTADDTPRTQMESDVQYETLKAAK